MRPGRRKRPQKHTKCSPAHARYAGELGARKRVQDAEGANFASREHRHYAVPRPETLRGWSRPSAGLAATANVAIALEAALEEAPEVSTTKSLTTKLPPTNPTPAQKGENCINRGGGRNLPN